MPRIPEKYLDIGLAVFLGLAFAYLALEYFTV